MSNFEVEDLDVTSKVGGHACNIDNDVVVLNVVFIIFNYITRSFPRMMLLFKFMFC